MLRSEAGGPPVEVASFEADAGYFTDTDVVAGSDYTYTVRVEAPTFALDSAAVTAFWDNDGGVGDGIPDWWERLHGLDPNNVADAGLDLDSDGVLNIDEFLASTDPTNGALPTIQIVLPTQVDPIYSRETIHFEVSAQSFGNSISVIRLLADGAAFATKYSGVTSDTFAFDWSDHLPGNYVVEAQVIDSNGNEGISQQLLVEVLAMGDLTVNWIEPTDANAQYNLGEQITLTAEGLRTGADVTRVTLYHGRVPFAEATGVTDDGIQQVTRTFTHLPQGDHLFYAVAEDETGEFIVSDPRIITIASTAAVQLNPDPLGAIQLPDSITQQRFQIVNLTDQAQTVQLQTEGAVDPVQAANPNYDLIELAPGEFDPTMSAPVSAFDFYDQYYNDQNGDTTSGGSFGDYITSDTFDLSGGDPLIDWWRYIDYYSKGESTSEYYTDYLTGDTWERLTNKYVLPDHDHYDETYNNWSTGESTFTEWDVAHEPIPVDGVDYRKVELGFTFPWFAQTYGNVGGDAALADFRDVYIYPDGKITFGKPGSITGDDTAAGIDLLAGVNLQYFVEIGYMPYSSEIQYELSDQQLLVTFKPLTPSSILDAQNASDSGGGSGSYDADGNWIEPYMLLQTTSISVAINASGAITVDYTGLHSTLRNYPLAYGNHDGSMGGFLASHPYTALRFQPRTQWFWLDQPGDILVAPNAVLDTTVSFQSFGLTTEPYQGSIKSRHRRSRHRQRRRRPNRLG